MSSGVESLNVPSWRFASTPEGYKPGYSSPCVERKQGSDKSLLLNIPRYNSVDKHATPSLSGKNLNFSPVFNSLPFTHSLSKLSEINSQTSRYQTLAQHKMAMEFAGMNGVEKLNGALSPSRSSDSPGLLRNILQQKDNLSDPRDNNNVKDISVKLVSDSAKDLEKNGFQDEDKDSLQSGEFSDEDCELEGNKNGLDAENEEEDDDDDDIVDEYGMMKNGDIESDFGENEEEEEEESKEVKRARLDNILTSMRQSPTNAEQGQNGNGEVRRKRKQYQPKWLEHSDNKVRKMERIALQDQLMQLQHQIQLIQKRYMELAEEESLTPGESMVETRGRDAPSDVSEEVVSSATEKDKAVSSNSKPETSFKLFQPHLDVIKAPKSFPFMGEPKPSMLDSLANRKGKASDLDIQKLSSDLKSHIANAISTSVDTVLKSFVKTDSVPVEKEAEKQRKKEEESFKEVKPKPAIPPPVESDKMPRPIEHKPFIHDSFRHDHIGNIARILEHQAHSAFETPRGFAPDLYRHSHNPLPFPMPPFSCFPPMLHTPSSIYSPAPVVSEPEQTEALPLVVSQTPKKKRTKVTDTRLSPRAARALLQDPMNPHLDLDRHPFASLMPHALPTSVAIPNPSLRNSNVLECYYNGYGFPEPRSSTHSPLDMEHMSPRTNLSSSPTEGLQLKSDSASMDDSYDGQMHMTSTLTPMHLRKAKLMFFYVRYPSSAILKVYFPDVKFNKNNTAQLVKWFSNFREFYYIQMEKYARQAIAEGCKHAEDLVVTVDSELYRVLNLHYNRNNQIEVPDHFRQVVQATLREFYKSIVACKDQEPSWKKAIYKIISRMDNVIPEYFKSPNWMDQLGDM